MWLVGIAVVVGGLAAGIGASAVAARMQQGRARHRSRRVGARAAASGLVSYRAPPRRPEDDPAYPLDTALLEVCLRATDAGTKPHPGELDHSDKRTRLALGFVVDAIAAVQKRESNATRIAFLSGIGWLIWPFLPLTWFPAIMGASLLFAAVAAVVLHTEWKRKTELRGLADSGATPTELAARLRELADWPPSKHDPLAERPFVD